MSEPAQKKRRLDQLANTGIHKPFRSPLKTKSDATNQTPAKSRPIYKSSSSSSNPVDENAHATPPEITSYLPSTVAHSPLPHRFETPTTQPSRAFHTALNSLTSPTLARTYSTLHPSLHLATLKKDISTLTQSLTIIASPRNPPLPDLITKWRDIARAAAEELFVTAKEKVDASGGMRGMRVQEEEREERKRAWEEEGREEERKVVEKDLESEEEGEAGGEGRNEVRREMRAEMQSRAGRGERRGYEGEAAKEEERRKDASIWAGEFTMGTMLKSLNVELAVLGYDPVEERWMD